MIAYYLGAVKRRAEQATGRELRDVVHGRPVHFVDNAPDADRKAEQTLREIAREVGFDDVTFQFEPIAAALDYERQIATRGDRADRRHRRRHLGFLDRAAGPGASRQGRPQPPIFSPMTACGSAAPISTGSSASAW